MERPISEFNLQVSLHFKNSHAAVLTDTSKSFRYMYLKVLVFDTSQNAKKEKIDPIYKHLQAYIHPLTIPIFSF